MYLCMHNISICKCYIQGSPFGTSCCASLLHCVAVCCSVLQCVDPLSEMHDVHVLNERDKFMKEIQKK